MALQHVWLSRASEVRASQGQTLPHQGYGDAMIDTLEMAFQADLASARQDTVCASRSPAEDRCQADRGHRGGLHVARPLDLGMMPVWWDETGWDPVSLHASSRLGEIDG